MTNKLRIPCIVGGAALAAAAIGGAPSFAEGGQGESRARVVWQHAPRPAAEPAAAEAPQTPDAPPDPAPEPGPVPGPVPGAPASSDVVPQRPAISPRQPEPGISPYAPSEIQARDAALHGEAADRLRYQVQNMESMLVNAVQHAADRLTRQIRTVSPDIVMLTGTPRARGVMLEGYGVFFSVDVPAMSPSVNWSLRLVAQRYLGLESALTRLRQTLAALDDPQERAEVERAIQTIETQVRPQRAEPQTIMAERAARATSLNEAQAADAAAEGAARRQVAVDTAGETDQPALREASPAVPSELLQNPSAAYEREVKDTLVDAVLDYAGSFPVAPHEWFTVAARDADYTMAPTGGEAVTIILRVKGADLAAFRAGQLSRDEAEQRVDIREF